MADYTAAIKIESKYREAYNARGNAYRRKDGHALAIADYTGAIKLNSKRGLDYRNRGTALQDRKDYVRAVKLASKACELTTWKSASYVDTLAAAHAEDGNYQEAVRRQEAALAVPEFEKSDGKHARNRLKLYKSGKPVRLEA